MQKQPQTLYNRRRRRSSHRDCRRNCEPVKQIVQRNYSDSERGNDVHRKMNERGKHDHRNAENPNHFRQTEKAVIKIEKQAEPDDGKFQHDQPQSARE